jgi:hypothetical protein
MASVETTRAVARLFEESWGIESPDQVEEGLPPGVVTPSVTSSSRASHVA